MAEKCFIGMKLRKCYFGQHQSFVLNSLAAVFNLWPKFQTPVAYEAKDCHSRPGFTKATVCSWRVSLEARGLGTVSINVRITAVRKLAVEAADNGLLAPELANGIARVKGVASKGIRLGNWLSVQQAQKLLNAPDATTTKGLRDRAILVVLLGRGLRRSEVAALTMNHVQQRDGRWCIVDLIGKHGRVRTVPMPTWVKVAIEAWTSQAGVADGPVFRPVNRGDQVQAVTLSEKVGWQLLQGYAAAAGVPGIAPHDLRRYAECRIMPNRLIEVARASSAAVGDAA
jgi:site-specific recombinase XerD